MMRITFLGTSAAAPTLSRGLPAIAVKREGALTLFDCGEGTQRQMMRYGTGFDVKDVFFTHLHADHFLGIIGFVRTLTMAERTEPMQLFCPTGTGRVLDQAIRLGIMDDRTFPVAIHELSDGDVVQRDGYEVRAFSVQHKRPALGYAMVEPPRPGKFHIEKAQALNIPKGPLLGKLQKGQAITLEDGRVIEPHEVMGQARKGRKIVVSGDTIPCRTTVEASRDADILIHEATFGDEEIRRASLTFHSTARQAAEVAHQAQVHRLILTHLSNRYATEPAILLRQAKQVFPEVEVARDGMEIELRLSEEMAESDGATEPFSTTDPGAISAPSTSQPTAG